MSETERRINDVRTALESLGADFDAVDNFSLTDEERSRIREQISQCYNTQAAGPAGSRTALMGRRLLGSVGPWPASVDVPMDGKMEMPRS